MTTDLSYEQAVARLKEVVEKLEQGSLDLEESLRLFEEGIVLSRTCDEKLRGVEARVQVLVEKSNSLKEEDTP